jgi:hypothetical protein
MLKGHSRRSNDGPQIPWALGVAILLCLLCNAEGQVKESHPSSREREGAQQTMVLLKALAAETISSGDGFPGATRLVVDQEHNTLSYDLNPLPPGLVLSNRDPLSVPLEAMIRMEALRRDLQRSFPVQTFWVAPLAKVQTSISNCVDSLSRMKDDSVLAVRADDCSEGIERQFGELDRSIQTFAKERKLTVKPLVVDRSPAIGYKVRVSIGPPPARVRFMTMLEYRKCMNAKIPLTDQWNDMTEGEVSLIGRYHYLADWPPALNGPEEGNFEIRKDGTLTFRPNPK